MTERFNKRERIKARQHTVQALYEWFMTGKNINDILTEFESDKHQLAKTDVVYFKRLFKGIAKCNQELDKHIESLIDRPIDKLDTIERAILHIGCYELEYHSELPWRVVVNESVDLAKVFGAEASYKYINGVLDKVARELRIVEVNNTN